MQTEDTQQEQEQEQQALVEYHADLYYNCAVGHEVNVYGTSSSASKQYVARQRLKLRQQAPVKTSALLRGVVCFVNGYTGVNTRDIDLRKLIMQHGGDVSPFFGITTVTHIVATSLSGTKLQRLLTKERNLIKVVRPEWVLDSVRLGIRQPERAYSILLDHTHAAPSAPRPRTSFFAAKAAELEAVAADTTNKTPIKAAPRASFFNTVHTIPTVERLGRQ